MEEKNNRNGIIIAILSVLLVIFVLYIGYDKLLKKETSNINNPATANSSTTSDSSVKTNTEKNEEKQTNMDTTGKIYVKRNGVTNLEKVPSDLVGTYENKSGGYFTINSDGTLYILEYNGDSDDHNGKSIYDKNNSSFQVTYIPNTEDIILEIYTKTNNGWLPSPFRLGRKDSSNNYSFALLENTPSVNANEFSYVKK